MESIKFGLDNFFIWFGDKPKSNKITIGIGEGNIHYTILFNEYKKVLDIHKTIELPNGEKKYTPLFKMGFFTLMRLLVLFKKNQMRLIRTHWLSKRINLGKLKKRNLILFPMGNDEGQAAIFFDLKRKKKMKLRNEIDTNEFLSLYKYPEEIENYAGKAFWAYSVKGGNLKLEGIINQPSWDKRTQSFFFISKKAFSLFRKQSNIIAFNILNKLNFENKAEIMPQFSKRLREMYSLKKTA
jgi:hypothetical protein